MFFSFWFIWYLFFICIRINDCHSPWHRWKRIFLLRLEARPQYFNSWNYVDFNWLWQTKSKVCWMQVYCLLHSGDWWYTFVPQKDAASDVGSNSGYLVEFFPSQFWKCNLLLKRSLKIKSSDNSNTVHTWYLTFSFLKNTTLPSPMLFIKNIQ